MVAELSVSDRIRALRGAKRSIDPQRPIDVLEESERTGDGSSAPCLTVFLAGAECPFTCRFCDLWRGTLDGPTPEGALPAQLEAALERVGPIAPAACLKLYNASNFFEPRAVPMGDRRRLAALAAPFERVVVECHPRLVDRGTVDFAGLLTGRLEVAMGLETVHPHVLPQLNKRMTLDDFDHAAAFLAAHEIDLRVFVLIGVPWLAVGEAVDWAVISAAYALERGARVVTLIPLRGGNGELDRLAAEGAFSEPTLEAIERAFERSLTLAEGYRDRVMQLDLWDLVRFAGCSHCKTARLERLTRMSATGVVEHRFDCAACGDGG